MAEERTIRSYQDLIAWQKALELSVLVYRVTSDFPSEERFGLTSQMRRAAVSVTSNIAEGWGRGPTPDFIRFLRIARGSAYELESQARIAAAIGILSENKELLDRIDETTRVINGLARSLEKRQDAGPPHHSSLIAHR